MAAAITDLTMMVSGLQPVESHDGGRGRPAHRRTTRRPTHTRRETPDPSDDSSSSNHARHGRNRRSRRTKHRRSTRGADGDSSPSSDDSSSSSSSNSSSSSSESEDERRTEVQPAERREQDERVPGRRSVKDLELPTFTPSPKVSVSTWIDRIDLALKGAAKSGRGKWSDHALYFILGNKLMENAAKWWVNQDRRLKKRQRTWTNLKKALLRRYGPKLDKSNAELRVAMRRMMSGETYADFAAGRVKERVLLAQFLRCLDKTTKKLVQQRPKPKTMEEAVDKATEIDDPMDNVAQGMANIGQPWAVAPSHQLMMMTGTTGPMSVIPGISGTGLPTEMANAFEASGGEASGVALFTNPQGVWNECSGTWDSLPGHAWNGKFWAETKQHELRRQVVRPKAEGKKPAVKVKLKREEFASSGEESDVNPVRKKFKAAVKQAAADSKWQSKQPDGERKGSPETCFKCGQSGHRPSLCTIQMKCFACNQFGHFARECPDADAKARNDTYLEQRGQKQQSSAENTDRAR
ncbi:hypothetical protein PF005_g1736 [Phytophthora fragariae]|uniref:CCHC-type domain-containing protein n=1 Tax=Phytophthora fragariae TaxID=53985 RepID=A0A6A4EN10_9STRA|nr:hypothetical protein PF003_g34213 [Phytophthora fragariae]KAE8947407.1 hypothetical protein PF009_g2976 [Phytophthora fragariae]KAE8978464.1 hypothetical protein PF011_g23227 [Phytophthora fragariae]KAE9127534.1 hypothetical protein PF010_g4844 [Phytophthora fragariae]KAE9137114.1 hypothetical protein PF007_g1926 [Phytophthora fragariae]